MSQNLSNSIVVISSSRVYRDASRFRNSNNVIVLKYDTNRVSGNRRLVTMHGV
jgi:predicted N-formylglutamate amidohydrolase